jgi:DNA-binding CsgD family transcriptional regulator
MSESTSGRRWDRRRKRHRPADDDPAVLAEAEAILAAGPSSLTADTFEIEGEEFVLFSFPLPAPSLPEPAAIRLTSAERAVALLLVEGASNEEIARRRNRSRHTVINQIGSIFRKLGVGSRAELFRLCASPASVEPDPGRRGSARRSR